MAKALIKPDYKVMTHMAVVHLLALTAFASVSWHNFWLLMGLNFVTGCLGITLGFHRLLTHRSFKAPKWFERFVATCGTLAMQGGVGEWVAHHRMHHAFSDTKKDPHDASQGFWFSHMAWLFKIIPEFDDEKNLKRYARDIYSDPYLRFLSCSRNMVFLQVLLAVLLFSIGGWEYVAWGIFLRLVVVYHITWFVNSACHKFGYKNYQVNDLATNCWWVGILAWGEGWHNNHHAHADVAPAGHKWWEFDITFWVIRLLGYLGIAREIKLLPEDTATESQSVRAEMA